MALETTLRRRRRLSMTSLIDVIFLLLLFFMLTSTFSQFGDVDLTVGGGSGPAQEVQQKIFVSLRADGLMVNGARAALADLPDRVGALRGADPALAVISLTPEARSQQLVETLVVLQGVPDLGVVVLE